MKRSTLQSVIVVLAILSSVIVLYFLGNFAFALGIALLLITRLLEVSVHERKDESAQLVYRSQRLTEPLQRVFTSLEYAPRYSDAAVHAFQTEIRDRGLSKLLKIDAPELFQDLNKLCTLVEKFQNEPYSEDEVKYAMGDLYKSDSAPNIKFSYVLAEKLEHSAEARELKESIRRKIEDVVAKYGGAT